MCFFLGQESSLLQWKQLELFSKQLSNAGSLHKVLSDLVAQHQAVFNQYVETPNDDEEARKLWELLGPHVIAKCPEERLVTFDDCRKFVEEPMTVFR